ncbi:DNA polymerase III subunit chi [Nitrospirillum amazonense]|uniref:DNA polymerase III chi subunit n=1 Tax=Nitrospirillum amazonense TaxID=28077 RepID=A0A560EXJ8_9PROT|nr:DNA polymerase III subunit chi [Nitrospirillum amazonense]MDG3443743.1 DNA polymerase III subunit chi [Nitrospirillum amazonense]TWB14091.1 DNA polymerase III chi subunit [Nitrospirillum amazonense]TWB77303.1 DNA polymerase III chi subunit [Nitrospirillum amazonense]
MTEVNFYHLQRSSLEQTLPDLLERSLARGWRAVVLSTVEERAEQLAQHLWTWRPDSFLPHGTAKDGHAADQPIWLTAVDERPNDAQVLFLTDGATSARMAEYTRVCDIFDGIDPDAVAAARQRWKAAKEAGLDLTYWQQTDKGWEKKA